MPIPGTEWSAGGDEASLAEILDRHGWREAVVKPAISASARATWRVSRAQADEAQVRWDRDRGREEMMVQAFVPEVVELAEPCLYFGMGGAAAAERLAEAAVVAARAQGRNGVQAAS